MFVLNLLHEDIEQHRLADTSRWSQLSFGWGSGETVTASVLINQMTRE